MTINPDIRARVDNVSLDLDIQVENILELGWDNVSLDLDIQVENILELGGIMYP